MAGGKHIQFLLSSNVLALTPSPILNKIYPSVLAPSSGGAEKAAKHPSTGGVPDPEHDTMLLSETNEQELAKALNVPELEVEVERAMWQVQHAIQKAEERVAKPQQAAPETKSKDE